MKVFGAAFLYLEFVFVNFWCKEIGKKAARKMLVKLTLVNIKNTQWQVLCFKPLMFQLLRQTSNQFDQVAKLSKAKMESLRLIRRIPSFSIYLGSKRTTGLNVAERRRRENGT